MKCLCCGRPITNSATNVEKEWCWHKKCIKRFFQTDELPILDVTKDQLEILANETVNEGLTVPGVQKKLSLHLSTDLNARLTIVDYPTGYILKLRRKNFIICRNLRIWQCVSQKLWESGWFPMLL